MSKLKYSLRRSFNVYILLMHYQRTDPQVDSDQWVISQRLHKAKPVYNNRWILFLVALTIRGRGNKGKHRPTAVSGQEIENLSPIWHLSYPSLAPGRRHSLGTALGEHDLKRGMPRGASTKSWGAQAGFLCFWSLVFSFATTELPPLYVLWQFNEANIKSIALCLEIWH